MPPTREESNPPQRGPLRPRALVRRRGALRRLGMSLVARRAEQVALPILGGPVFFQIARTACRLDLIGLLRRQPGLTLSEIRQHLKLQEQPARILLLGCVALGLLKQRRERFYCRSPILSRMFDPQDPNSFAAFLEWMHRIVAPSMQHFDAAIREARAAGLDAFPGEEDTLYGRIERDPQLQAVFYDAMNARTGTVNELFLERIDFSQIQRVLDVGGGDGEILAAIARRYPHLRGTLLEMTSVATKAGERFTQEHLSDRLQAVAADMLRDDFPAGHDCVLFCHVNGNHSDETNRRLLQRAFAALNPGGLVGIYSAFMHDDASGPLSSAMLSAYFYCTISGQGRQYSWQESERWLAAAGFTDIIRVAILQNHGVILGRKP